MSEATKLTVEKKVTVLERIKKLDEERAKLLTDAKQEALSNAENAIRELNELGFSYRLTESAETKAKRSKRNTDPSKRHCPICDVDGHDGRAHRAQKKKTKFSPAELKELAATQS